MNTPSHLLINAALWKWATTDGQHAIPRGAFLLGAVLPDIPLWLLWAGTLTYCLATGYRPALDPIAHALTFDDEGHPVLDRYGRAVTNPRLVCVGYTYPTTEGWLQAIGRVAEHAVDGIAALPRDVPAGRPIETES